MTIVAQIRAAFILSYETVCAIMYHASGGNRTEFTLQTCGWFLRKDEVKDGEEFVRHVER
jgi:hypothetical protein